MTRICLTMIVRNEAAVLARCLRAAKPCITDWCIVDTGSEDRTMDVVREELDGIPGRLYERPWQDFGHNRTESFGFAQLLLLQSGADLTRCWCLLLDADFELETDDDFDPEALVLDGYSVEQTDGSLSCPNVRLIRADLPWRAVEVTHEYWTAPDAREGFLPSLLIIDHADGGMRGSKLERDVALLTAEIARNPDNHRAVFYLGQTLENQGKMDEALACYEQRMVAGGYWEEPWIARLRLGRILLGRDDPRGATELLQAYEQNARRAEPLVALSRHYRLRGNNHLGHLFATQARALPVPSVGLFVETHAHTVGPDEDLSITGWYVGDHAGGLTACERLLARPEGHGEAERNVTTYAQVLPATRCDLTVPEALRTFDGVVYHCSNPCVCEDVTLVRLVGYEQERGRNYWSLYGDGRIRTQVAIRQGAEPFRVLDTTLPPDWPRDTTIVGLEDMRLCAWQDRWWFTATCCQVPGCHGNPQVVLGELSQDLSRVEHVVPIHYAGAGGVEKNWLLWPTADALHCVYSFAPFVLLEVTAETGDAIERVRAPTWTYPGRFRGSAGPVAVDDRAALFLVHDVARMERENVYTHRLILANHDGDLSISAALIFDHHGIEYACGMTRRDTSLLISYGVEDRRARMAELPLADALRLCREAAVARITRDQESHGTEVH